LRAWINEAALEYFVVRTQARDTVRIDTPEVGCGKHVGGTHGILFRYLTPEKDSHAKIAQVFDFDRAWFPLP
jgi:hypothetical protein